MPLLQGEGTPSPAVGIWGGEGVLAHLCTHPLWFAELLGSAGQKQPLLLEQPLPLKISS